MAGKSQQDEGALSVLWPVKVILNTVLVALLSLVLWFGVLAFYLWRFVPSTGHTAHIEHLSGFYVAHSFNPTQADAGGKVAYQFFLQETGVERSVLKPPAANKPAKRWDAHWLGVSLWDFGRQAVYIFGVKIATVLTALPLMLLAALIAFLDGAAARYVRREEGGNESATRYHIWKKISHSWVPVLSGMAFLVCPTAVNPVWFLGFVGLAFVFGVRNQAKYFKKYL